MEEQLRKDLLMAVAKILGEDTANRLEVAFTMVLYKYKVEGKSTDIVVYDDSNNRIIKNYVASLRLEGKSELTIDQYYRIINIFLKVIGKPIKQINTGDIRYYLAKYMADRRVEKTTLDNQRRAISAFFSWLTAEEYIDRNPMLRIKKIKIDKRVKKSFSDIELEQLRNYTQNIKEKALMEFLLSTGCRVTEVARLHIQDIDFNKKEAVVYGKGDKERVVYISDRSMYYLRLYLDNRKEETSTSIFLNRNHYGMTKHNIEVLFAKLGERAGVNKVHPHRFRRTFATRALRRGMSLQNLQKLMGHEKIETTMGYCDVAEIGVQMEFIKIA
jgi:site-specific recombinase XerD